MQRHFMTSSIEELLHHFLLGPEACPCVQHQLFSEQDIPITWIHMMRFYFTVFQVFLVNLRRQKHDVIVICGMKDATNYIVQYPPVFFLLFYHNIV